MSGTCRQAFCCSHSTSGFGLAAMLRILRAGPLSGFELQRHSIHAVALAGRLRTVGKHMAEMAAALRALDLHPRHAVAAIGRRLNGALDRAIEARPAAAALVLRVGGEERLPAGATDERAVAFFLIQWTGAGA